MGTKEAVVAAGALEWPKKPTSRSRLDAREEVAVGDMSKCRENLTREVAAVAVR